ncbi:RNA polymerase II assembly factor RTP1 [Wickerhamiella sorbophila]|uniref:RNA polymerase II assembly factor RTP1 n=1 Tax=Wickerhamiella sorbophila TaxID=45607 RepID=A0A2T0FI36_9ASCO|nr:RNA polymerase II assembly factor RTP1 [Wickerhamiella sorbophila]PRT54658.1 RNA polymerase II assembly factor RTP1 [Wickerhamiella sorbophila]
MDQLLAATKQWLDEGVSSKGADIAKLSTSIEQRGSPSESVIWRCVDVLLELQSFTDGKQEIIKIALEDMKTVSTLMRVIACYGIYPCVDAGVGPPMESRTEWAVLKNPEEFSSDFLERLLTKLLNILRKKDDLADIILIGPYTVDIITGSLRYDAIFEGLSDLLPTYTLYQLYTGILPYGPSWVQQKLSHSLAVLPLKRSDAVRALIEFLTGFRESEHVNTSRLTHVTQVLCSIPKNTKPKDYIGAIGVQIFNLLASVDMPPEITAAVVRVTADLSETRPQMLGALRDRIVEPFIKPSAELEPSLVVLMNLVSRKSDFVGYLAEKLALHVWALLAYLSESKRPNGSTLQLVVGLINLKDDGTIADSIARSLGQTVVDGITFGPSSSGSVETRQSDGNSPELTMEALSFRINLFLTVLNKVQGKIVSSLFSHIIKRYTASSRRDALSIWSDLKLLEGISSELRAKLFEKPNEIVDLTFGIIDGAVEKQLAPQVLDVQSLGVALDGDSDDEEDDEEEQDNGDLVALGLSLLSSIILEAFSKKKLMRKIGGHREQIEVLTKSTNRNIREKSSQCIELLDTIASEAEISLGDEDTDFENSAALLKTARESLANPLIPVRAHGLTLISELIKRQDNTISLDEAMSIMLREIQDDDSFIYLNAIRGLEACSAFVGPGPVLRRLATHKSTQLDVVLRKREAMTRIVQLFGPTCQQEDLRFLADYFLAQSRPDPQVDDRLRMSAISILGLLIQGAPLSLTTDQEGQVADLVLGVLTHERSDEQAIVRRSAIVLLLELVNAKHQGGFKNLSVSTLQSLKTQLGVAANDSDELIRKDARELMESF